MTTRDWRNRVLVAIAAAFCFGGSFTCTTHDDDDDKFHGHVAVSAIVR